ncbi:hypothetical protein OE88DRAFT_658910 [Heliocybe sulcata]|uniref:Uncharacterized protein n=1 Tax=Heliocybe sulcata TaxID=5364 RepID=A0A5C3NEM0_9AGAM|nr:hypothetical protein OE88DRAFT_658910 [Heliocybe sulcata]
MNQVPRSITRQALRGTMMQARRSIMTPALPGTRTQALPGTTKPALRSTRSTIRENRIVLVQRVDLLIKRRSSHHLCDMVLRVDRPTKSPLYWTIGPRRRRTYPHRPVNMFLLTDLTLPWRPPASTERSRGEYSQPPRSHAQYHSPSHTTQHMTSRDHVQPLIHTVSRRRHAETYYIIPSNRPVIFKDEHGKEITRVGDFSGRKRSRRKHPLIIQDEFGRELYRTGDMHDDHYGKSFGHDYQRHHERFDGSDHSSRTSAYSPGPPEDADSYGLPIKLIDQWGRPISPRVETVRRHGSQSSSSRSGRPSVPPNVILIDDFGNQIPIQVQPTRTDAGRYQSSAPQVYGQHPQMMSSRDAQTF